MKRERKQGGSEVAAVKKSKEASSKDSVVVIPPSSWVEPKRRADNTLIFDDFPSFRPSLLPHQVLEKGAFGGSYFRPISSGVTGKKHSNEHEEFAEHFRHIDKSLICRFVFTVWEVLTI